MKGSKGSNGHPGDNVRERHLSFIRANFEQLAAECYRGFLEHGRGMLLGDESDFAEPPRGHLTKFKLAYMAEENAVFKAAGGKWPGGNADKEARWVKEYDPETTVLIAFTRRDGGVSSYRIEGLGDGTPLCAYNRIRATLN